MRLRTLIFLASLLAPVSAYADACTDQGINSGDDFVNSKVFLLPPNTFDALNNGGTGEGGGTYQPPQPPQASQKLPASDTRGALLSAAFSAAPPFFQSLLCGLNWVFIDQDNQGVGGWGFWEAPDQPPGGRKFIGISAGFFSSSPKVFEHESNVLLGLGVWDPVGAPTPPAYFAANENDPQYGPAMTLLGILAHEMGHILWVDGSLPPNHRSCHVPDTWAGMGPEKRFRDLGIESAGNVHSNNEPYLHNILEDISKSDFFTAAYRIQKVYGLHGGRKGWASLLATVAPDEDFAETLKLVVLTQAPTTPLTTLSIRIPPRSSADSPQEVDIIPILKASAPTTRLSRKARCIRNLF